MGENATSLRAAPTLASSSGALNRAKRPPILQAITLNLDLLSIGQIGCA